MVVGTYLYLPLAGSSHTTQRYASAVQLCAACTCSLSERALGHGGASILLVAREVHEAAHGAWLKGGRGLAVNDA